jgi:hypothetical protein
MWHPLPMNVHSLRIVSTLAITTHPPRCCARLVADKLANGREPREARLPAPHNRYRDGEGEKDSERRRLGHTGTPDPLPLHSHCFLYCYFCKYPPKPRKTRKCNLNAITSLLTGKKCGIRAPFLRVGMEIFVFDTHHANNIPTDSPEHGDHHGTLGMHRACIKHELPTSEGTTFFHSLHLSESDALGP